MIDQCMVNNKPYIEAMRYAIISHNVSYVSMLRFQHKCDIPLDWCGDYNNIHAFCIYLKSTWNYQKCLNYSPYLQLPNVFLYEYLIAHGANINSRDKFRMSVLHYAAESNFKPTIEYLFKKGSKTDTQNFLDQTPFQVAMAKLNLECIKAFVSHGADIDTEDSNKWNLLHYAARFNSFEIAKYAVSEGININVRSNDGLTALHLAVSSNNLEMAKYLISRGIYVDAHNAKKETALHLAVIKNYFEM